MNYDSFSHGQIQSKLWLCKELERCIYTRCKIAILGSWYNVLSFMIMTRGNIDCQYLLGIDIDPETKTIADQITNAWQIGSDYRIENITADATVYDLSGFDVVINCSPEHMKNNDWFDNIQYGTTVCIQSSDVTTSDDDVWKCVNPNTSLSDLAEKYPLSKYHYSGEREFRYSVDNGYNRFMIIGIK